MPAFTAPAIPQVLTPKHWQATRDVSVEVKNNSKCNDALERLSKAYQRANFDKLPVYFKNTPAWSQYNYARWVKQCDDLVREVIVGGVISLREATGEVRNKIAATEKLINKKDELAPKSVALLRKMLQAADSLLKDLRPEVIEESIRGKEREVNQSMFAIASKPLEEIKVLVAKARAASSLVMKKPEPEIYNKVIGSGSGGLVREFASLMVALASLPSAKGIDYDGAASAARLAKGLLAQKPLPAKADQSSVTNALRALMQDIMEITKLPKLKLPS